MLKKKTNIKKKNKKTKKYNKESHLEVIPLLYSGDTYAQKGELDKAIELFNKALAIDPQGVSTLSNLGYAYAQNNELEIGRAHV